jgi:hypothetical protein
MGAFAASHQRAGQITVIRSTDMNENRLTGKGSQSFQLCRTWAEAKQAP